MKIEIEKAKNGYVTIVQYGYFPEERRIHNNVPEMIESINRDINRWFNQTK